MNSNSFLFYGRTGENVHASVSAMVASIDGKKGKATIKQVAYATKATIFLYIF